MKLFLVNTEISSSETQKVVTLFAFGGQHIHPWYENKAVRAQRGLLLVKNKTSEYLVDRINFIIRTLRSEQASWLVITDKQTIWLVSSGRAI